MKPNNAAALTLCYLLLAGMWIVLSRLFVPSGQYEEMMNAIAFVAITSILVYYMVHRLEKTNRANEAFRRAIIDASPVAVYSVDLDGTVLTWNKSAEAIFGWTAEESVGRRLPIVPADKQEEFAELRRRAAAGESLSGIEVVRKRKNGSLFQGRLSIAPILDHSGTIKAIMATMEDVTSHISATEALKESEERFRTLVEAAPEGILIQVDGRFAYVNTACAKLMGADTPEQLIGTRVIDRIHPDDRVEAQRRMEVLARHQRVNQIEQTIITLTGEAIPVENAAVPFRYRGKDGGLGFIRDVSRRRQRAQERETLLKAIEQTADAIIITNTDGVIEHVNPAFERSSGYSSEEAIDQTPRIQKSGQHDSMFYDDMWQTISKGNIWRGRIVNKRKDGTLYTEDVSISPLLDNGAIISYVAVKRDVTHELSLEHQLNQAQKMETVGRLAGGVAHDFNNMLSVILGYSELILARLPKEDPIRNDLTEVTSAAHRSANLTRQLLAFARQQIIEPRIINLNETIESALKMLERLIGEHITLQWQPDPSLWPVKVDPTQIDQILANLAINARDAIADQGHLSIRTTNRTLTSSDCNHTPELTPGRYVIVTFSDDGEGIQQDVLPHVFEPFFTTKPEGAGTGLGLSTVYGIVKQNHGHIVVESKAGQGTTFNIYLPCHKAGTSDVAVAGEMHSPPPGQETILLVEDEKALLVLGQEILERLGYTVIATDSPSMAIKLANEHKDEIDLLLTDVVMPEMNGRELYEAISGIRPDIKLLFTSGYTSDTGILRGLVDEQQTFLQKPYSSNTLAAKVRDALEG